MFLSARQKATKDPEEKKRLVAARRLDMKASFDSANQKGLSLEARKLRVNGLRKAYGEMYSAFCGSEERFSAGRGEACSNSRLKRLYTKV